jgi:aspartate/methionine/tyrosine aminotransferase
MATDSFPLNPLLTAFAASPTLAINEKVQALWAAGQEVYHLGFGESRFPLHPLLAEALATHACCTAYLPAQGLPELRVAVAAFYRRHFDLDVTPDRVIIGPGSKPLLFALMQALVGDVLLPIPSWVSYAPHARMSGKRVFPIPTDPADGYALHLAQVANVLAAARRAGGDPRLLVLNSPSNPTGRMLTPEQVAELAAFCRQEGLFILSDEIYALTAHGHVRHVSPAWHYPEGTAVVGGLSKHLSLGGWRLGVAVLPPGSFGRSLMAAVRAVAAEVWSSPTAPVQYAAITAYGDNPVIWDYIQTCTRLHALRTHFLWRELSALGIPTARPEGAFYVFVHFDPYRQALARCGVTTSAELAAYLLEHYHLATLPGSAFGAAADHLALRLSSSYLDMETTERAQALLEASARVGEDEWLTAAYHPVMHAALARWRRFVADILVTGDG